MSQKDWYSIFVFCLIVLVGTALLPRETPERVIRIGLAITIGGGVIIGVVQFALTGALQ